MKEKYTIQVELELPNGAKIGTCVITSDFCMYDILGGNKQANEFVKKVVEESIYKNISKLIMNGIEKTATDSEMS